MKLYTGLTWRTRWCRRTFVDIPWVKCGCLDCRLILLGRWIGRQLDRGIFWARKGRSKW